MKKAFLYYLFFLLMIDSLTGSEQEKEIIINKKTRTILIPGTFNMTEGVVEFLAVNKDSSRVHESVFLLNISPSDLQKSLKEIGLQPPKDQVVIDILWEHKKQTFSRPAHFFLFKRKTQKTSKALFWSFTGSQVQKEKPKQKIADINGELISLQPNVEGIIRTKEDFGNPYDNKELGFEINQKFQKEILQATKKGLKTEEYKNNLKSFQIIMQIKVSNQKNRNSMNKKQK